MMKEIIAKKYVKALFQACNNEEVARFQQDFSEIAKAFGVEKFDDIIYSPEVKTEDKEAFALSLLGNQDEKLKNFIKILAHHNRLGLIPEISEEVQTQLAINRKQYRGVVVSKEVLAEERLQELQQKFSQKVDAEVILEQKQEPFDGIRIFVEALGIEIGFSKDRLQSDIGEHVLRAI